MTQPRISVAEWEVMKVLWAHDPLSANQVIDALASTTDWHPKTVRTLLTRLVDKGVLGKEKQDGLYVFTPRVEETACVRDESRSFLDRCFGGSLHPMLAHFLEHEDPSDDEIAELRRLLDEKDKERRPS